LLCALSGSYPITKVSFPYIDRPSKNVPFEVRVFKRDSLREKILYADNMDIEKQESVPNSKTQDIKQQINEQLFE
jgi:hypothetical protein